VNLYRRGLLTVAKEILFDTTYLLPLLGIRVRSLYKYEEYIPKILDSYKVYYHPVSLIEAKWKLLQLKKDRNLTRWRGIASRYRQGLNYILNSGRLIELKFTNPEVEDEVDYLIENGYRDYFDLLIFTSAYIGNLTLVTEDVELMEIPSKIKRYRDVEVINWGRLIETIK